MWCVSYYLYFMTVPWVSEHYLFKCTCLQHAINCMTKRVHPNTVVKIKNKNFSVFA